MVDKINKKIKEINSFNPKSEKEIEEFRIKYLGKKGELTSLFLDFKNLDNDKKKTVGKLLNELKLLAQSKIDDFKKTFSKKDISQALNDIPRPGDQIEIGSRHPI